jgi:hypothetical protein
METTIKIKTYTLSELSEIVAKHIKLDMSKGWDVHLDFYKKGDYIFTFTRDEDGV